MWTDICDAMEDFFYGEDDYEVVLKKRFFAKSLKGKAPKPMAAEGQ